MEFKWRKWNRVIHRDFGYFFFGLTVIYSLSGIVLNHIRDFNPNYIIKRKDFNNIQTVNKEFVDKTFVLDALEKIDERENFKSYYLPNSTTLKIFIQYGSFTINLENGTGVLETVKRRPLFYQVNFLHYNNAGKWWKWISDFFAGSLILISITGLFILKGKNGITRRGAWLTIAGLLLPTIFLLMYL